MKYVLLSFIVLLFINCGGGGDSSKKNKIIEGYSVNLGYISGATVKVKTLDDSSRVLYEAQTDDKGSFSINRTKIKEEIKLLGYTPKLLLIEAHGGIDLDPNDDGIIEKDKTIEVKGIVKSIIFYDDFMEGNISTNLLTTAVAEILKGKNNITKNDLDYLVKKLDLSDINNDGKINTNDMYSYNMVLNDSKMESDLRLNFLGAIHNGNKDSIQSYIEFEKIDKGLAIYNETIFDSNANINIKVINTSYLKYSHNNTSLNNQGKNINISLFKGEYLRYVECNINECYKKQLVYFDGIKTHNYILMPSFEYNFEDNDSVVSSENRFKNMVDLYSDVNINGAKYQNELKQLQSDIDSLEKQIGALK